MEQQDQTLTEAQWPKEPYKGFAYYGFEDSLIFACRENDVEDCLQYLAEPNTRTLLLHGRTGCGKSSFLRAGLIPELEDRGFGFVFLRRKQGDDPSLIRCTSDPITRIAEELFRSTDHPWQFETAIDSREIDLTSARLGKNDIRSFTEACRDDPYFLMKVLSEISSRLVDTLVIILDQAEEAITADEMRSPFFDFLKLFNAATSNIKLIVALRTERFGEFFGYLHFGPSVITDVKQYFLQALDRQQVRQAIELPTLKVKVRGHNPPFEVYGFEYEPGLIDQIVADLFAAPPSGGILPLMQVVCRGLYNEVRGVDPPRTITMHSYVSGGGVSGRVDKQIGQSLRAAIRAAQPYIREMDTEERKWRTALYKLVRTQPDGTVGTDLKTEEAMFKILEEAGIDKGISAILADLTQPDVLILRSLEVTSIDSGSETTLYCLGHDAIGLVLRQWTVREDEAEKRRLIEMVAHRRTKIARVVATIALGVFVVAALIISLQANHRQVVEAEVLQSFADNVFRSDPATSAAAAINSSVVANRLWWGRPVRASQETLANIAATLPNRVVKYSFEHLAQKGFLLPFSKRFLFSNGKGGFEIASWNDEQRRQLDVGPARGQENKLSSLRLMNAVETTSNILLLQLTDGVDDFVTLVRDDRVIGTYDSKFFLSLSEEVKSLFEKQEPGTVQIPNPSTRLRLYTDAGIVYLYDARATTMSAFFVDEAGSRESAKFRVGGSIHNVSGAGTTTSVFTVPPGIVIVYSFASTPANSAQPRARLLNDVAAYDLRKEDNKLLWSISTFSGSVISQCLNRPVDAKSASSDPCVFRQQDRESSGFVLIDVPRQRTDGSGSGKLVALDVENKRAVDFDIDDLIKTSTGVALGPSTGIVLSPNVRAPARQNADFSGLAVGGTFGAIVFAVLNDPVIDVFEIVDGRQQFIGTYTAPDIGKSMLFGEVFFTPDERTMVLIDGSKAVLWDISETMQSRSKELAKLSPQELIRMICGSRLPLATDIKNWRALVGLDINLINPCDS